MLSRVSSRPARRLNSWNSVPRCRKTRTSYYDVADYFRLITRRQKHPSIKRSWMQAHRSSGQSAIVLSSSRRGGRWWCLLKVILLLFFFFFFVHNSGYGDRDWSRWSTQAVSDTGSGGCPPEVVMAGAVLVVVVVGTGSGCRACMSQVWEPRFFRSWNNSYFGYVSI